MRPRLLPDNAKLLLLEAAGLSHEQIAKKYGVSRQAVTKRFNDMGEYRRAHWQDATGLLPWDIARHPDKAKIRRQTAYAGLRAFLRKQLGQTLSPRSQETLRQFLDHINSGEVLELDSVQGVRYVQRDPERDGSLVIRWPEGVPRDERIAYFHLSAVQEPSTRS